MEKENNVDSHTHKNDKEITLEEMIEIRKERKKRDYYSLTDIRKYMRDENTKEVVAYLEERNILNAENGKLSFTSLENEYKYGHLYVGVYGEKSYEQVLLNKEIFQDYVNLRTEEKIQEELADTAVRIKSLRHRQDLSSDSEWDISDKIQWVEATSKAIDIILGSE